jgi:group I intron endonuclease
MPLLLLEEVIIMTEKTNCGIYQIRNLANGKKYIGKTKDLVDREEKWSNDLRPNSDRYNEHIKHSFAKHGEENFDFSILDDDCEESELNDLEIQYIAAAGYPDHDLCYNITRGGTGGDTLSNHPKRDEIIKKNSGENNWVRKLTPEEYDAYCKDISERMTGENNYINKMTPEEREECLAKRSDANSGENNYINKMTPEEHEEHLKKRSGKNHFINKMSVEEREECLAKTSAANSGENNWVRKLSPEEYDEECKRRSERISGENNPFSGKNHTGENNPFSGKNHTEESIEKMKENHPDYSGENNPKAILTDRQVQDIKYMLLTMTYWGAVKDIAALYGVNPDLIYDIKRGKNWTHVKVRGFDI